MKQNKPNKANDADLLCGLFGFSLHGWFVKQGDDRLSAEPQPASVQLSQCRASEIDQVLRNNLILGLDDCICRDQVAEAVKAFGF